MENRYKVLSLIASRQDPITSTQIQDTLGFSRRSIVSYVQQLNNERQNLILSTNKGYIIKDLKKASELLDSIAKETDVSGYEKRKQYVLANLLLREQKPTIQELADALYVSYYTMNKDLLRLRKELKDNNLYIKSKNERLSIIGDKKTSQAFLMNLISKEWEDSKFSFLSIQSFFNHANIADIKKTVDSTLRSSKYTLDDFSAFNYVLHLAISIETMYEFPLISETRVDYDIPADFSLLINQIYTTLVKNNPKCHITEKQIMEASVFMLTRLHTNTMTTSIPQETMDLINKIITALYNNYGISLNDDTFIFRFAYHIKNLLHRARTNICLSVSPALIKDDYPMLYIIANYILHIISDETKMTISENEVLYIALHIGSFLENKSKETTNITYDLVILDYLDIGNKLSNIIQTNTKHAVLHQIVSSYDEIGDVDFIITTLPEDLNIKIPQIRIHLFPNANDIEKINQSVFTMQMQKETNTLKKEFKRLLHPNFFYIDKNFREKDEVISFLCRQLEVSKYVDTHFMEDILHHEAIVPSEIHNIAIPHPLLDHGNHVQTSIIAIWMNKESVKWVRNQVNFVFMLALLPEDISFFQDIFEIITTACNSKEFETRFLQCTCLDDFIDILLEYKIKGNQ